MESWSWWGGRLWRGGGFEVFEFLNFQEGLRMRDGMRGLVGSGFALDGRTLCIAGVFSEFFLFLLSLVSWMLRLVSER